MKLIDSQHSTFMIKVILAGTFIVSLVLFSLLLISMLILNNPNLLPRVFVGTGVLAYVLLIYSLYKKSYLKLAAWMLILLYSTIPIILMFNWGINAPVAIIMFGFVILLSGAMLGSKYVFRTTTVLALLMISIFALDFYNLHTPNHQALSLEPVFGDLVSYLTIFGIFTVITWLSIRKMEQSLTRALKAEKALEKERNLLANKLEKQIQLIKNSQKEEIMQLYRFAELGQLTTVVLHEMANNLSILSLDIDDIDQEYKTSASIVRTKESIRYLEDMVSKVRKQLGKTDHIKKFNANLIIKEVLEDFTSKTKRAGVLIVPNLSNKYLRAVGDPLRLSQVITILINNAVDACINNQSSKIIVTSKVHKKKIEISVIDYGSGISEASRKILFEPLRSTKQNGLGIGLFISKQIIETHFKGSLLLDPSKESTKFTISIPTN